MKKSIKEQVKLLLKAEGEARGIHFKNDAQYIVAEKGEDGLKKVEDKLKEWGVPLFYNEIRNLHFYPMAWRSLSLLAAKEALGWEEKNIRNMCEFASSASLIIRIYSKFFYSIDKFLEQAPRLWEEYFTIGKLIVREHSESEKYVIIDIKEFDLDAVYRPCLESYMKGLVKMIIKGRNYKCEAIECSPKENNCSGFKISWE